MGSLQRSLFGGSKQKSQSNSFNQAYPFVKEAFSPLISSGTQANSQMANLLGLNGEPAQTQGFDNWRKSTGYNFGLNQGMNAITGSAAAKGLLNSGATARALSQFGQDYGATKFGDYMSQLQGLVNPAIQAGGLITGAGQISNSSSKGSSSQGGFGSVVGSLFGK